MIVELTLKPNLVWCPLETVIRNVDNICTCWTVIHIKVRRTREPAAGHVCRRQNGQSGSDTLVGNRMVNDPSRDGWTAFVLLPSHDGRPGTAEFRGTSHHDVFTLVDGLINSLRIQNYWAHWFCVYKYACYDHKNRSLSVTPLNVYVHFVKSEAEYVKKNKKAKIFGETSFYGQVDV